MHEHAPFVRSIDDATPLTNLRSTTCAVTTVPYLCAHRARSSVRDVDQTATKHHTALPATGTNNFGLALVTRRS